MVPYLADITCAVYPMGLFYGVVTRQEDLDDLVVVVVSCQYEGWDIWGKLTFLLCAKEGVAPLAFLLILAAYERGVLDNDLDQGHAVFADGVKKGLLDTLTIHPEIQRFQLRKMAA